MEQPGACRDETQTEIVSSEGAKGAKTISDQYCVLETRCARNSVLPELDGASGANVPNVRGNKHEYRERQQPRNGP